MDWWTGFSLLCNKNFYWIWMLFHIILQKLPYLPFMVRFSKFKIWHAQVFGHDLQSWTTSLPTSWFHGYCSWPTSCHLVLKCKALSQQVANFETDFYDKKILSSQTDLAHLLTLPKNYLMTDPCPYECHIFRVSAHQNLYFTVSMETGQNWKIWG